MFFLGSSRFVLALTAILAVAGNAATADAQSQDKLDHALREGKKAGKSQHVILKAKPGYEAWARQLLNQNGKEIESELPSIGAMTAELTAGELDVFCKAAVFLGCSEDAYISPSGFAADKKTAMPARGHGKTISPLAAPVYSAPAMSTLLGTLGLSPSPSAGFGVTVAVIDSGIYPSPAFAGRITHDELTTLVAFLKSRRADFPSSRPPESADVALTGKAPPDHR